AAGAPEQQQARPADVITDLVNPRSADDTGRGYLMVPAVISRWLLPVAFMVALHLLLRGHNEPGGRFGAGLIVAVAFIMQYLMLGTHWVEARARLLPLVWIGAGLLLAAGTWLGALAVGYPFLTTHTARAVLPLSGEAHLPTATFFDIGVFAVVVGATLLILTALA